MQHKLTQMDKAIPKIKKPKKLFKIKHNLLIDVKKYLKDNKEEVLKLTDAGVIDGQTKIAGEFFDNFLSDRIVFYMPGNLKDILNMCLEEPAIVADLARITSLEPTPLMIIKDSIRFHLKDYVYRRIAELAAEVVQRRVNRALR